MAEKPGDLDSSKERIVEARPDIYSDEESLFSMLRNSGQVKRLSLQEEQFHTTQYYDSRSEQNVYLSQHPKKLLEILDASPPNSFVVRGEEEVSVSLDELIDRIKAILESEVANDAELLYSSIAKILRKIIFAGNIYDEFYESNTCQDEDFIALYKHMSQTRDTILNGNLVLIIGLAKKYKFSKLTLNDLFQEGFIGLRTGLDRFDPERGYRFSTYVVWWIRQAINQALSNLSRTIRIPSNLTRMLRKIHKTERELLQTLGREPSSEEIADHLEVPAEKVRAWQKMQQQPITLESIGNDQEDGSWFDLLADENAVLPDEKLAKETLQDTISLALDTLSEREQEILKHRFGLFDYKTMTLEELSYRFEVTHERIRQIEQAALKKLRDPQRIGFFEGYH